MDKTYHVLTGPTASGKTDFLLNLATHSHMAVISADSRQVYRYMDIGTGKPVPAEQQMLPHYGIDCLNPGIKYSAYQFLTFVIDWFRECMETEREVWVCGGTGLYIYALVDGLELGDAPRPALRMALEALLKQCTAAQLATRMEINVTDPNNPARVIRAAELACADPDRARDIYECAGLDKHLAATEGASEPDWQNIRDELAMWRCLGVAVLDPGRDALIQRIEKRIHGMFNAGLVDEVADLRHRGFGDADVVCNGIGYREAGAVLDGNSTTSDAIEATIIRTRQYAKRQRTYNRARGWQIVPRTELISWIKHTTESTS